MTHANTRTADHPIDAWFLERWSPRAYDESAMPHGDLLTLLEAARWAPSSFNVQPWRYLYATRDTPEWERFLGFLNPFNASWAKRASVLLVALSDSLTLPPNEIEPVPLYSHSFDAGGAWACLALQAARLGYQAHGMVGFDRDKTRQELNVPDRYRIEAVLAVGRPGAKDILPEPLRAREVPSPRNPVESFAFEGEFPIDD